MDFNTVHFLFQSDGINSYFNTCIFVLNADTEKEAIDKQKKMSDILSKNMNYLALKMPMDLIHTVVAYPHYGMDIGVRC